MAKRATATNKPTGRPKADAGRVFTISLEGIPRVDAQAKARLDAAAKNPSSKRRSYPKLHPD